MHPGHHEVLSKLGEGTCSIQTTPQPYAVLRSYQIRNRHVDLVSDVDAPMKRVDFLRQPNAALREGAPDMGTKIQPDIPTYSAILRSVE